MTKVRIDTPGVTVEIEADGELEQVAARALQLYQDAGGWPQQQGAAVGFASTERRPMDCYEPAGKGMRRTPREVQA